MMDDVFDKDGNFLDNKKSVFNCQYENHTNMINMMLVQ